ncbi:MAG: SPOR domain-containing protein [Pseudomonadota bacterium]
MRRTDNTQATQSPLRKGKSVAGKSRPGRALWWLALGLCVGLFVAFLVYINENYHAASAPAKPNVDDGGPSKTPKMEANKPRFEFYHMLPEMEVVVPEAPKQTPQPNGVKPPSPAQAQVTQPGKYVLQAGAFRSQADADRQRATLALLGVEASIHAVKISADETWYRVQAGPFQDLKKLNELRVRLEQNRVETMLLRFKG